MTWNWACSESPVDDGPVTLSVIARSAAGIASDKATYSFEVAAAKADAIWMFDEGAGTTSADTGGHLHPQTLTVPDSSTIWTDGPHELFESRPGDHALRFNGVNQAATTGPVVKTAESFTLSAFVWLDAAKLRTGTFTAVSQDGVTASGFALSYVPSCATGFDGCWSFRMKSEDKATAPTVSVNSTIPAVGDAWVHLVAEHNAAAKTMRFWACEIGTPSDPGAGEPKPSGPVARAGVPWAATGALAVGRGLTNGAPSEWWPGRVDNLRLFSGEIVADDAIRRICHGAEAKDFDGALDAIDPTVKIQQGEE